MFHLKSRRQRGAILTALGVLTVLIILGGLTLAGVFNKKPQTNQTSPDQLVGTTTTQPNSSGSASLIKFAGVEPGRDDVSDADRKMVDQLLDTKLLKQPENLQHWQLCKPELTAEARATQAWADAMKKYPEDKPYTNPDNDPSWYNFLVDRAQAMRDASTLAEKNGIACISDLATQGHWLEFTLGLPSGTRKVIIPDRYLLLYVHESAEEIANSDPPVCADTAQVNWEKANAQPVDTEEATDHESWSERSKYGTLEEYAAEKDLRTELGRIHC